MDTARRAFTDGDLATTERICAQVLASNSSDWRVWALLTETALLRGRPDAATVSADRAIALAPTNPIALALRAKCLFVKGETRQACAAVEAATQHLGEEPDALDAVGAIFSLLGLQQRARELF